MVSDKKRQRCIGKKHSAAFFIAMLHCKFSNNQKYYSLIINNNVYFYVIFIVCCIHFSQIMSIYNIIYTQNRA